ncbi:MAG: protocatechuate 3,4-dioxygenase [Pseudomonadota bacterium]
MTRALPAPEFDLAAPGTLLYDGPLSTQGYALNNFCLSLKQPANRARFLVDEAAYASSYGLSAAHVALVTSRDWTGLLNAGGHLQAVLKLAATVGCNLYHLAGHALGVSADDMHQACPRVVARVPGQTDD